MHLKMDKNIAMFKVLIVAKKEDAIIKITSLEKRQFIHVLEGIKQGLKAQDK
jgi:hypothetical protein